MDGISFSLSSPFPLQMRKEIKSSSMAPCVSLPWKRGHWLSKRSFWEASLVFNGVTRIDNVAKITALCFSHYFENNQDKEDIDNISVMDFDAFRVAYCFK